MRKNMKTKNLNPVGSDEWQDVTANRGRKKSVAVAESNLRRKSLVPEWEEGRGSSLGGAAMATGWSRIHDL